MKLIITEGFTSTGKSTLARKLSMDLDIPAYFKDDYKESHFDLLEEKPNLKQLRQIEQDSWSEILKAITSAVEANKSLIVEANFFRSHKSRIQASLRPNVNVVETFCYASGFRILRRYIRRNKTGERHKGHRDNLFYLLTALNAPFVGLEKRFKVLHLTENLIYLNTNDFDKIDYASWLSFIRNAK